MIRETEQQADIRPTASLEGTTDAPTTTRRAFLGKTGTRVAFIMPAVWTLTARQALAAGSNPSGNPSGGGCAEAGEPCVIDSDCCDGMCMMGMC